MQRQHTPGQDREVENRDEEWNRRQAMLADNLDRLPDLREGDRDAGRRLVLAPQDGEGVVGEGGLAHADVPDARSGHQSVDEPDDDVGIPVEGRPYETKLPSDRCHVG
jgi:hypothetical protein